MNLNSYTNFINKKMFLTTIFFYFFSYFGILRANYYYIDDLGRSIFGRVEWGNMFSRYISDFTAKLINLGMPLIDISPLPQFFCIVFLTISTLIVIHILAETKINVFLIIAALPIGLFPYFLENFSYKFEASFMALSILFSCVPFFFCKETKKFIIISILGLLGTCMTYQAATGVYIVLALGLVYKHWFKNERKIMDILKFLLIAGICYILSLCIFKFVFMKPLNDYVSTDILSINSLGIGILKNLKKYTLLFLSDLHSSPIEFFLAILILLFIILSTISSHQNKFLTFFISICFVLALFFFSFGAYVILKTPLFAPRAFISLGVSVAIISVFSTALIMELKSDFRFLFFFIVLFSYSMIVFSYAYGNALIDQKRYTAFRVQLFLQDINEVFPSRSQVPLQIKGSIGYAPTVNLIAQKYPLIRRLVPVTFTGGWTWGYPELLYYGFSYHENESYVENYTDFSLLPFLSVKDTSYHEIKTDGQRILLILK